MTEGDKKNPGETRISETERYKFIGFDVFPGKPEDLFKDEAEKQKLIEGVKSKRKSASTLREACILLEERVTFGEKLILAASSLAILVALTLPWYSAYTVVPIEAEPVAETSETADPLAATDIDTLAGMGDITAQADDSLALAGLTEGDADLAAGEPLEVENIEEEAVAAAAKGITIHAGERANEQIITAHVARAKTTREYSHLTGFGAFASLGSVGPAVFSSGFVLVITGVLMLIYALLCIVLPVLNFYTLFGIKGTPDETAEKIKKYLRFNWLPLILFGVVLFLSFFGADYGFNTEESFTSLGESYSVAALLGTMSWGIFVALAASVMVAVKGIEI